MMAAAMGVARRACDALLGRGSHAVTVPPMDGALKPNRLLDVARVRLEAEQPDNLLLSGGDLLFSSGAQVFGLRGHAAQAEPVHRFDSPVSASAVLADGRPAFALESGEVCLFERGRLAETLAAFGGKRFQCITALLPRADGGFVVAEGSATSRPGDWRRDLLERRRSGSVWMVAAGGGSAERLAAGLAFPSGLAEAPGGGIAVCEAWAHRIVALGEGGRREELLSDLPGYPWRMAAGGRGTVWLTVAAPRSQLVEFVLRETEFRRRMMAEIDPAYWVAPALSSGRDFREPMQGGAIKSMGILKPWAPTRSYGLLVQLDARFQPVRSFHSRADGRHHGITSVVARGDSVLAASRGGGRILEIDAGQEGP
jgi:hypothetical protein